MVVIYNIVYTLSKLPLRIQTKLRRSDPKQIAAFCSLFVTIFTIYYVLKPSTNQLKIPSHHNVNFVERLSKERLNAIIVEEHHEVLPYWFGASDSGKIPKYGNTLIHIDAHADMDVPQYTPYIPFFRYPTSKSQIVSLMQKNDMFILGAAITGLIKQIIWVLDDWVEFHDMFNATHKQTHTILNADLGWMKDKDGRIRVCLCVRSEDVCQFPYDEETLKKDCQAIHDVQMIFIVASESHRIPTFMQSQQYILDIDEDYFGVERVYDKLEKKNITLDTLGHLDELLNRTFSLTNVQEEKLVHDILINMINLISQHCILNKDRTRQCRNDNRNKIYDDLSEQGLLNYAIGGSTQYTFELHRIAKELGKSFTDDQRELLAKTGFCLNDSPNTSNYNPDEPTKQPKWKVVIHTCVGHNLPEAENQIKVFPNLRSGEQSLNKILKDINRYSPGVITIARSNRDGYVPRHQQADIERIVMKSLNKNYPRDDIAYVYDGSVMTHLGHKRLGLQTSLG